MHPANRPTEYQMPRYAQPGALTASQYMKRDSESSLKQAVSQVTSAAMLATLTDYETPDGWCLYVSSYGSSINVSYSLSVGKDQPAPDWRTIARTIVDMRNAYHIPVLKRDVQTSQYGVQNRYTGHVTLTDEYGENKTYLSLKISTGDTLPATCHMEQVVTKERKTVKTVSYTVVCD